MKIEEGEGEAKAVGWRRRWKRLVASDGEAMVVAAVAAGAAVEEEAVAAAAAAVEAEWQELGPAELEGLAYDWGYQVGYADAKANRPPRV